MCIRDSFISGAYTGNSNSFTFNDQNQKWFGSALFGVNLEVPIFSSLGRSAKSQIAKISYEQSKTKLENTEQQIKVSVKLKLLNDPEVQGTRIGVSVYRGVVTLSGRVPSEYARGRAHQITSDVRGVESTVDKLTIVD